METYFESLTALKSEIRDGGVKAHSGQQKMKKPSAKSTAIRGVGFGGCHNGTKADIQMAKIKSENNQRIDKIVENACSRLGRYLSGGADLTSVTATDFLSHSSLLLWTLGEWLRTDCLLEISNRGDVYRSILELVLSIAREPLVASILTVPVSPGTDGDAADNLSGSSSSAEAATIMNMLQTLSMQAGIFVKLHQSSVEDRDIDDDGENVENALVMALHIDATYNECQLRMQQAREIGLLMPRSATGPNLFNKRPRDIDNSAASSSSGSKTSGSSGSSGQSIIPSWQQQEENEYLRVMRPLKFEAVALIEEIKQRRATHVLLNPVNQHIVFGTIGLVGAALPAPPTDRRWINRVASEMSALVSSLPVEHGSAIFVRCDENRMDVLKALIIGPEGTPYANGCFEFDLMLPPDYPNKCPSALLVTTGKGKVRFNPNLYESGKVCLSLLGTWEGPSWEPLRSTLLQVLVSIQSLILVPDPYFNEPGLESLMKTAEGKQSSKNYNHSVRRDTAMHAILEQLLRPSTIFADIIFNHYRIKRRTVIEQLTSWAREDLAMMETVDRIVKELTKTKYLVSNPTPSPVSSPSQVALIDNRSTKMSKFVDLSGPEEGTISRSKDVNQKWQETMKQVTSSSTSGIIDLTL